MGTFTRPDYRAIALEYIRANPGVTAFRIKGELYNHSRAVKWFGNDSFLANLFGPSSGTTYALLMKLETSGIVRSEWGFATAARGWRRSRRYWVK